MTSSLTPEKGRDYQTLMSNLRMAETVCQALEVATCAHFVYLSSDAVYGSNKIPLNEDSTLEPSDLYALSHIGREMMLGPVLARKKIPSCILRLTSIYGAGDTHNAYGPNRFVRSALRDGQIKLYGRGEEHRSHVFIEDAIRLIGLTLQHRSSGVLNIASREAMSFAYIADTVTRLVEHPITISYLPRTIPIIRKPYKLTPVFRFLYKLTRPVGPIVHRTFVNSAIFTAYPEFRFTPFETGVRSFIATERAACARSTVSTAGPTVAYAPRG